MDAKLGIFEARAPPSRQTSGFHDKTVVVFKRCFVQLSLDGAHSESGKRKSV